MKGRGTIIFLPSQIYGELSQTETGMTTHIDRHRKLGQRGGSPLVHALVPFESNAVFTENS